MIAFGVAACGGASEVTATTDDAAPSAITNDEVESVRASPDAPGVSRPVEQPPVPRSDADGQARPDAVPSEEDPDHLDEADAPDDAVAVERPGGDKALEPSGSAADVPGLSDRQVPALTSIEQLFECPLGSEGAPTRAAPVCTTVEDVSEPAVAQERLVCPRDFEPTGQGVECAEAVSEEERGFYECPLPGDGRGVRRTGMECFYVKRTTYALQPPAVWCPGSEVPEFVDHPTGNDLWYCLGPGPDETVGPVEVNAEGSRECEPGWTLAAFDTCERTESVPAKVTNTTVCPADSQPVDDDPITICKWPDGSTGPPDVVAVGTCADGQPLSVGGVVSTCLVTERTPALWAPVLGCPGGFEPVGSPVKSCVRPTVERRGLAESECPTGERSPFSPYSCFYEDVLEFEIVWRECPTGTRAVIELVDWRCADVATRDGTLEVDYDCPTGGRLDTGATPPTCRATRGGQIEAIEVETVVYRCPAGTTGTPTADNPWCERQA